MPELPDLEVLKERLRTLVGDSITSVKVLFPLTFRVLVEGTPEKVLSHQSIQKIERRGKFLIFTCDTVYVVFNMMLTGRLHLTCEEKHKPNTVVVILFSSGRKLQFTDFKKMGKIYVTDSLRKVHQYAELGVEPLSDEFTEEKFSTLLKDPREIKIVLTDQKVIAGIGNAYVDEILFHARMNPRRKADSLKNEEVTLLHHAVITVLERSIHEISAQLQDTSEEIRDFFSVHGKKGQPCPVCGSVIREIEVSKRITHVCPECQQVRLPW